jgi:hypothetical protein
MKNSSEFSNELLLSALHVSHIEFAGSYSSLWVHLEADGPKNSLAVMSNFINAGWLNDLNLQFLDCLLNLPDKDYHSVSLREEGWAVLENDGKWVRVSDSFSDERCAIVLWEEFKAVVELKRDFLCLFRYCKKFGIPRYSLKDGFRIRLGVQSFQKCKVQ